MNDARRILLLSTSTVHGSGFLEYCTREIADHFEGCGTILFVPYASPGGVTYDDYTDLVARQFTAIDVNVEGIHSQLDPDLAVREAEVQLRLATQDMQSKETLIRDSGISE